MLEVAELVKFRKAVILQHDAIAGTEQKSRFKTYASVQMEKTEITGRLVPSIQHVKILSSFNEQS